MCMLHDHGDAHVDQSEGHDQTPWHRALGALVLLALVAVAGYFLWTEHPAHVIALLPYALLLLCPLMHLFMHHGHRRQGRS